MQEDVPNLLKVLDETEDFRRQRQAELNSVGWPREVSKALTGKSTRPTSLGSNSRW